MVRAVRSTVGVVTMTRADGRRTKEEERPTHVGFGSAEVVRTSTYHGDGREACGTEDRIPRGGERRAGWRLAR